MVSVVARLIRKLTPWRERPVEPVEVRRPGWSRCISGAGTGTRCQLRAGHRSTLHMALEGHDGCAGGFVWVDGGPAGLVAQELRYYQHANTDPGAFCVLLERCGPFATATGAWGPELLP